jgi:sugar O-acyltransferase (sialic acid O-acetyltransferase NeuD family)
MGLQKIVIIGAGGFGREVLDVFDAVNSIKSTYDMIGYVVDPQYGTSVTYVNDKPILGGFDWFTKHKNDVQAICGVGIPELRKRLVESAKEMGVNFCSIVHPNAILTRWVTIGEGTVITAGCILTNQIRIGNHVHVNLDCTIGHDVIIEDFATLGPGVHVSGNVVLGEGCYIGTGANIIEKKQIGAWSIVGAGSTIVTDVLKNTTVVGVPGKVISTRLDGWHLTGKAV